jgi:hypothetical protein
VGELRYLWERGVIEDRLCGCGERFAACPFWCDVMNRAFGARGVDARRMMAFQNRGTRLRHLPLAFARRAHGGSELAEYHDALAGVVRAVRDVSGASVVVDSSKLPPYGALLRATPGVDLRVVHLVRDPRATAFSWDQAKAQPDRGTPGLMQRQRPWKAAGLWATWNAAAELLGRSMGDKYLRLRYEDFIAQPTAALRDVVSLIGLPDAALPLLDGGHRASLAPSHTVAGNPDRFHDGAVALRTDERWKAELSSPDRRTVTAIAFPLMRRYGYSLGPTR